VVHNASRDYDNEENILKTLFADDYYQLMYIPYLSRNWQTPLYCSHYKIAGNPGIIGGNNSGFWIRGYDYTNIEGFRDFLRQQAQNGTPLCVVWEMATPLTYHFDNIGQLQSLLGTNNIWADCGDVEVEYRADTKLYIQKINAPMDADMTADTQIANGRYFIIGNNLYLSTTTIPAGDTIIPGTNCIKTNLAEALNALNT